MIIKVPQIALNKGLTDNEMVLSALMLFLSRTEGKKSTFNFYSDDIKILLGHIKETTRSARGAMPPEEYGRHAAETKLERLRKVLKVGILNHQTWSISFGDLDDKYLHGNGWIKEAEAVITDPIAVKTYCFLVGKLSNGSIVEEGNGKLYSRTSKKDIAKGIHHHFIKDFTLL